MSAGATRSLLLLAAVGLVVLLIVGLIIGVIGQKILT